MEKKIVACWTVSTQNDSHELKAQLLAPPPAGLVEQSAFIPLMFIDCVTTLSKGDTKKW